ncbi:MAG: hypothetical protein IKP40_01585 [Clostridia bacterium]|nr:hypothetical protein [Clostridia bacterium]
MADAQRKYKDRLFGFLFGGEINREWTLSLYNAVNGSHYTDASQIEISTIREVLYLGMHNDVSFMISDEMNMYEQQSSFNPNMPLRMLQYAASLFERHVENLQRSKYSSRLIHLPTPRLVVFYNGRDDMPDEQVLRLSDAFAEEKRELSDIDVRVRMVNINKGHSLQLMSLCKPLDEYAWMVDCIRQSKASRSLEEAIDFAIDIMPGSFEIKPCMELHRAEVKGMLLTEYNEAKERERLAMEAKAEGRAEGEAKGRAEYLAEMVIKMLRKHLPLAYITDLTDADEATIRRIAREANLAIV